MLSIKFLILVRYLLSEDLFSSKDYYNLILPCEYPFESDIDKYSWKNCVIGHNGFVTSNDENGPPPIPSPLMGED